MLGCDFAVILLFFFVRAALPPQVLVCPSAFPPLPEGAAEGPWSRVHSWAVLALQMGEDWTPGTTPRTLTPPVC